jgi:hypothetical protein
MNYDLAKQLKDAGFPQTTWPESLVYTNESTVVVWGLFVKSLTAEGGGVIRIGGLVKHPSLSELIEACVQINPIGFSLYRNASGTWVASTDLANPIGGSGDTPEEAVAILWLALHEKNSPQTKD